MRMRTTHLLVDKVACKKRRQTSKHLTYPSPFCKKTKKKCICSSTTWWEWNRTISDEKGRVEGETERWSGRRQRGSLEYELEMERMGRRENLRKAAEDRGSREGGYKAGNSFCTHRIRFAGEINSLLQIIASFWPDQWSDIIRQST